MLLGGAGILLACFVCQRQTPGEIVCDAQESGSDVHQHKQALKDLEAKLVVRSPIGFLFDGPVPVVAFRCLGTGILLKWLNREYGPS